MPKPAEKTSTKAKGIGTIKKVQRGGSPVTNITNSSATNEKSALIKDSSLIRCYRIRAHRATIGIARCRQRGNGKTQAQAYSQNARKELVHWGRTSLCLLYIVVCIAGEKECFDTFTNRLILLFVICREFCSTNKNLLILSNPDFVVIKIQNQHFAIYKKAG